MPKFIFVTGGFISGIGKGVTTASLAYLLKKQGYKISIAKCENYLNVDSGTINPVEHGDPFLTKNGYETDMDFGTYERFLNQEMDGRNFITMGQLYRTVIDRERAFGYDGKTVEPVESIALELIDRLTEIVKRETPDIVMVELGGTVGEFQNYLYYEATKLMNFQFGIDVYHLHVAYIPFINCLGEPKSKPVQLSVKSLNSFGITPDFLVVRTEVPLDDKRKIKLVKTCNIRKEYIIENLTKKSIYEVPIDFDNQNFSQIVLSKMNLKSKEKIDLSDVQDILSRIENVKRQRLEEVPTLAIVGKYFSTGEYSNLDSYSALIEAVKHSSLYKNQQVNIKYIDSETYETDILEQLVGINGLIVPIGFGSRGVEGKITAIKYARENKIPYLGLCFGMQLACIEWARNVMGIENATSEEINPLSFDKIIHQIPEVEKYVRIKSKGVSMRLGEYPCELLENSLISDIYNGAESVSERHRHRFEFNNEYREQFEESGFIFSGVSPDNFFVEMIELPTNIHPFFVATQAHPEYKSTPFNPHPMFVRFIEATTSHKTGDIAKLTKKNKRLMKKIPQRQM